MIRRVGLYFCVFIPAARPPWISITPGVPTKKPFLGEACWKFTKGVPPRDRDWIWLMLAELGLGSCTENRICWLHPLLLPPSAPLPIPSLCPHHHPNPPGLLCGKPGLQDRPSQGIEEQEEAPRVPWLPCGPGGPRSPWSGFVTGFVPSLVPCLAGGQPDLPLQ